MPNDTLDEIEARWKDGYSGEKPWTTAHTDIRTLIAMVRARDRVVEAAKAMRVAALSRRDGSMGLVYAFDVALAALDAPPAQEQKR